LSVEQCGNAHSDEVTTLQRYTNVIIIFFLPISKIIIIFIIIELRSNAGRFMVKYSIMICNYAADLGNLRLFINGSEIVDIKVVKHVVVPRESRCTVAGY